MAVSRPSDEGRCSPSPLNALPHDLDVVIDFVNTLDLETGDEQLDSASALEAWLSRRVALAPGTFIGAEGLAQAIALREALRVELRAHNGSARDPAATAELERVAERGALSVHFCADGTTRLEPRRGGFEGVLARLLVPVAQGAGDGSWARAKACVADECQAAFYDRSRNRSGRWCDMSICGNRTKVRMYRSRHGSE